MRFSKADIEQINEKGISENKVEEQIEIFRRGNIPVNIDAAATVGNGINQLSTSQQEEFANFYDQNKDSLTILKFVPASGAATRMFKSLHQFLNDFEPEKESLEDFLKKSENLDLKRFFDQMEDLPFYSRAVNTSREIQPGYDGLTEEAKKYIFVQSTLFSPGLNLSNYPKGLVPFHDYEKFVATAFEEHLYEAAAYAAVNGVAKLHFTVSQGHREKFQAEFDRIQSRVEEKTQTKFEIDYSYQNPKTDTIAVDDNFEPFRTDDGKLFFRPGGHGALIENLNEQDADVIFIKNIDNVVVESKVEEVASWKKRLAGKLLKLQQQSFSYLNELEKQKSGDDKLGEMKTFIEKELFAAFANGFDSLDNKQKAEKIKERLNRPLRVCGMVKNEGEPGGGPFLVNMENGSKSLQIIEGAQIDKDNPQQQEIAQNATHFNPVDIVCGIRNYKGESFDLEKYIDPNTSFIAQKTKDGKALQALELPGLWNGAMAKWNTVFVEVPVDTFNPVKTVADLLKGSHQVK